MDSFEYITRKEEVISKRKYRTTKYKNAKKELNKLKKEKGLSLFFKNYDSFYNLKNYRDFIIHKGRIKQDKSVSQADRYIQYNYHIPELQLTNNEYKINDKHLFRLDYFCRLRYIELIYIIWMTLNSLINQKDLNSVKEDIKGTDKEHLKEVLKYLGRKIIWNDKSFMRKKDVEHFLKGIGLNFSDLIVEKELKERQMEKAKSVRGEDMSYLMERTFYKPIKGLQFNKIKYNYDRDWKPEKVMDERYGLVSHYFKVGDIKAPKEIVEKILYSFIKLGVIIKIKEDKRYRYEVVEEELQEYIATLLNLSQYKWMFIQHPQIEYFRKPNLKEKKWIKQVYKEKFDEQMKKKQNEKRDLELEYKKYKKRMKEWEKFKKKHNLDVKNFKKNSLNYKKISQNWKSGSYKEIRDSWAKEYHEEGMIDIMNKSGTQRVDCIQLLDYLHEVNTDFKQWKQKFKGKKFEEIKKLARKVFHKKRKHWLDMQKRWLKEHKKSYLKMLEKEKKKFSKIKRKYCYLNKALKLINEDFFTKNIKL